MLIAYTVPSNIPSLGYSWTQDGVLTRTISVNGKVISRKTFRPPKKHRRRIGRRIRQGWKIDNAPVVPTPQSG